MHGLPPVQPSPHGFCGEGLLGDAALVAPGGARVIVIAILPNHFVNAIGVHRRVSLGVGHGVRALRNDARVRRLDLAPLQCHRCLSHGPALHSCQHRGWARRRCAWILSPWEPRRVAINLEEERRQACASWVSLALPCNEHALPHELEHAIQVLPRKLGAGYFALDVLVKPSFTESPCPGLLAPAQCALASRQPEALHGLLRVAHGFRAVRARNTE